MQKTQIIQPEALQAPFAIQGDKNIPNYEATGTETCSIKLGFLPITSEQLPPDGNGQAPERIDFNGMFYLTTDFRVFLQNGGLITFDSTVSSKIGGYPEDAVLAYTDANNNISIVRSCIDDNTQNFISDPTLINGSVWELVYFNNFSLIRDVVQPIGGFYYTPDFTNSLPANCIDLDGTAISRSTYSKLFAIYGTTYGAGDGSTTFNLPNFVDKTLWGGTTAGEVTAGLPNITGSFGRVEDTVVSGAFSKGTSYSNAASGSGDGQNRINFDASNSNSIYGSSNTVRPPAYKVRWFTRYE